MRRTPPFALYSFLALLALSLTSLLLVVQRTQSWTSSYEIYSAEGFACVGFRATDWCTSKGKRLPHLDVGCHDFPPPTAGYCLCENRLTTAWVGCGMHSFTCAQECALLSHDRSAGRPLPTLMTTCLNNSTTNGSHIPPTRRASSRVIVNEVQQQSMEKRHTQDRASPSHVLPLEQTSSALWDDLGSLIRRHGHSEALVRMPPSREENRDFVADGLHLDEATVAELQASVQSFKAHIPRQVPIFEGRGIVLISGGLRYMTPAWVCLKLLRHTGSTLPVEMWFPVLELPTPQLEASLASMGVTVRTFAMRDLDQSGFLLKSVALTLSRFQEVLFLDADSFVLQKPDLLWDSAEYKDTGALLWQDLWDPSVASEAATILGLSSEAARHPSLRHSHDSGQMLIDKGRHWSGLVISLYMNYYSEIYWELLTGFMGKGDKETFVYAFLSAGEQVHTVQQAPIPLGTERASCDSKGSSKMVCQLHFACNTMLQTFPGSSDSILFMHSNLDKITLAVPDSFQDYTRRWMAVPAGAPLVASSEGHPAQHSISFPSWVQQIHGVDIEWVMYDELRSFRCLPSFPEFYRMRVRKGDEIMPAEFEGLHEQINGMNLLDWWRAGLSGPFIDMLPHSWRDDLQHLWNGFLKRTLIRLRRLFVH